MRKMLITNCPNCGGELPQNGECKYCGTKVRFENELRVDSREPIEILIKRTERYNWEEHIVLIPFNGFLIRMEEQLPELTAFPLCEREPVCILPSRPIVNLEFEGTVGDFFNE